MAESSTKASFAVVIPSPSKGRQQNHSSEKDNEKAIALFSHAKRNEQTRVLPRELWTRSRPNTSQPADDLDAGSSSAYTSRQQEEHYDHNDVVTPTPTPRGKGKRKASVAFDSHDDGPTDDQGAPTAKDALPVTPRTSRARLRQRMNDTAMDDEYRPAKPRTPKTPSQITPRRQKDKGNPVAKPSTVKAVRSHAHENDLKIQDFTKRMHRRVRKRKKYADASDTDTEDESTIDPELYKILDTCLHSLSEWAVRRGYTPREALDLMGLPYLFNKRWKKTIADFRKPNPWNIFQSDQHRNKLIPEEHKGRKEAAQFLSREWKDKDADELAEYREFRDEFAQRSSRDPAGHQAASQKISRRMGATVSWIETMGVHGFIYVADTAWTPGTRVWGTKLGGDFTELLGFVGLGHHMFEDFCRGQFAWGNINKIMEMARGTYVQSLNAGDKMGVVSEAVQQSLVRSGLHRLPENGQVDKNGIGDKISQTLTTKERLKKTFGKVSGTQHEQDHADVQRMILALFNKHLLKPRMKCPDKPWADFMKMRRLLVRLPAHITWDEFEGPKLKRRNPETTLKLKNALIANSIDIIRERQPPSEKPNDRDPPINKSSSNSTATGVSESSKVVDEAQRQQPGQPHSGKPDVQGPVTDKPPSTSIATGISESSNVVDEAQHQQLEHANDHDAPGNKPCPASFGNKSIGGSSKHTSKDIQRQQQRFRRKDPKPTPAATLEEQWAKERQVNSERANTDGVILIDDEDTTTPGDDIEDEEDDIDITY